MFAEMLQHFLHGSRPEQLELRQAQSAPPVARRAGSKRCRSGPLPLNHNEPPCSRNRSGEVGSMPSVRFRAFAFFFARRAASTLSGVNGDSCRRMPTALWMAFAIAGIVAASDPSLHSLAPNGPSG